MDIQVSSNFERLLFDLHGRDGAGLGASMKGFEAERKFALTPAMRTQAAELFTSTRVDPESMNLAMRRANEESAMILDPHSAIGYAAALAADLPADVPVVTLATAHPAKFRDAVERATGGRPPLPLRVGDLFDREERYEVLPADLATVQAYIAERATPTA
jgi:threonine synthase